MILIGTVIGFTAVLEAVMTTDAVVPFDQPFGNFLQSLRTTWTDTAMVGVTLLADWPVTTAVSIVACVVLLIFRRFRLAIGLLIALASTLVFVDAMRVLVEAQRPIKIYSGAEAFSFPSSRATMTATLYGVLGWIALRGAGATLAKAIAGVCVTMITAVAFSRIYLGANWPSDVAAGLLFGVGVTAAFALVFRGYELRRRETITLISACATILLVVGAWYIQSGYSSSLPLYARQSQPTVLLSKPWRNGGWQELPSRRIDLGGETEEPLLLQWRGSAGALQDELSKHGWLAEPAWSLTALNTFLRADTGAAALPVIPMFNDGRRQATAMIRPVTRGRFVLRAWSQDVSEQGGAAVEILVGSIIFERIDRPLSQFSIPSRSNNSTCNGDELIGGLSNSLRVGDNLHGPEWACGGRVVLAW
jgi:undecaprenyl-diphosphatase